MQVSTEESGDKPCILSFYPWMCFGFNRQLLTCLFRTVARNGWMQIETQILIKEKEDVHTPSFLLSWFSVGTPVFMTCHIAMGATQ